MNQIVKLCEKCWLRPVKHSKYRPSKYCVIHTNSQRSSPAEKRAYMDRYAVENRFQILMGEAERNRRGIPYDIPAKERYSLKIRFEAGICEMTGVRFKPFRPGGGQIQPYAASLDRVDPGKGYTYDNCRWVLQGINYLRNKLNDPDFKHIVVLFVANSPETMAEVSSTAAKQGCG
jgi:hypothetical protein